MNARAIGIALLALATATGCCSVPDYAPSFWNDGGTVQWNNNCYNYSNNVRTDTYAQPGRAAGAMYSSLTCASVHPAAQADGLDPLPASGQCDKWWMFWRRHTRLALVVGPDWDYHWYRLDKGGMWSHKPGGTPATNLDNSGNPIADPETADRGNYTDFCGYFCSCSSATQGGGHEVIQ